MVQAPPGTGKTTLVPPAVAEVVAGRVVVTQPSRIAARAAARRLAHLLGEPVGETVGYSVRGDRRSSRRTRVEIVTTGLLLRRIQHDPELVGVGAVVLDEVHERHLDADLTLALLIDVRANLREDLVPGGDVGHRRGRTDGRPARVVPADDLWGAPVIRVPGALHPVEAVWCPLPAGVRRTDDRGITPAFHDHVAATVRRALVEHEGDVLVFVPGVAEVEATVRRLAGVDASVHALHGRLSGAEQDRALERGPASTSHRLDRGRRVVADGARGTRRGGCRVLARAAHRSPSRTGFSGHRRGEPCSGRAAGGTGRTAGSGDRAALLVRGGARASGRSPGARDRHRRSDGLRPGGGLLGQPRRPRHGAARPATGARTVGGQGGAGGAGGDDRGRESHLAGPGDRRRAGRSQAGACPHRRGRSRRGQAGRRGGRDAERGRTRSRCATWWLRSGHCAADQRAGSWRRQVTRLEEVVAKQGMPVTGQGRRATPEHSPMTWRWVWWWPWRIRTGSRASAPPRRAT